MASACDGVPSSWLGYGDWESKLILSLCLPSVALTVVLNTLVLLALLVVQKRTSAQDWYIVSLALSDFLTGLVAFPLHLYGVVHGNCWDLPNWVCRVRHISSWWFVPISEYMVALIAYDRLLMIHHGAAYKQRESTARIGTRIAMLWIGMALLVVPANLVDLFMPSTTDELLNDMDTTSKFNDTDASLNYTHEFMVNNHSLTNVRVSLLDTCHATFGEYRFLASSILLICVILPGIICIGIYAAIILALKRRRRRERRRLTVPILARGAPTQDVGDIREALRRDRQRQHGTRDIGRLRFRKAWRTMVAINCVFFVCWLPVVLGDMYLLACKSSTCERHAYRIGAGLAIIMYVNSMLNPLVYTLVMPHLRNGMLSLICPSCLPTALTARLVTRGGPQLQQQEATGAPSRATPSRAVTTDAAVCVPR